MRNVTIVLAVAAVLALAGSAWADTTWDGSEGSDWFTAENWDDGVPTGASGHSGSIVDGGTAVISSSSVAALAYTLIVGDSAGGTGHLEIYDLGLSYSLQTRNTTVYANSTITHEGGQHYLYRPGFTLVSGGTYYLKGGELYHSYSGGTGNLSSGLVEQSGGEADLENLNINVGATYKIYGGEFHQSRAANILNVEGTFHVKGAGGTITVNGDYTQTGTLIAEVVGANISQINVGDEAAFSSEIDMEGTPVLNQEYTLLVADYLNGLPTLKAEDAIGGTQWGADYWTIDTNVGTDDDTIDAYVKVTYVPEPATMVLLGLGGIGVLIRRKRR